MSGGRFDYNQYHIEEIANAIESVIEANGKTRNQLHEEDENGRNRLGGQIRDIYIDWIDPKDLSRGLMCFSGGCEDYGKFVEEHNNEKVVNYSKETIREFKKAVEILRKAYVYAQRIDWLLSDDDGEDSFLSRLKDELDSLKHGKKKKGGR